MPDTPTPEEDYTLLAQDEEASQEHIVPTVLTGFLVLVDFDGNVRATADLDTFCIPLRQATTLDMRRACAEVVWEVNNSNVVAAVAAQVSTQNIPSNTTADLVRRRLQAHVAKKE